MIELDIGFGYVGHEYLDAGFFQEPALGGEVTRVDRPGGRFMLTVQAGPFLQNEATRIVSRLIAARSEGLRIPYPLQWVQGSAGAPVMDGADQEGTTIALRGLSPGYVAREGYFLSIEDANGDHVLHNVKTGGMADASGDLSLVVQPELKADYADGAKVHLSKPMIQGWPIEQTPWASSVSQSVPITFTLKEAK